MVDFLIGFFIGAPYFSCCVITQSLGCNFVKCCYFPTYVWVSIKYKLMNVMERTRVSLIRNILFPSLLFFEGCILFKQNKVWELSLFLFGQIFSQTWAKAYLKYTRSVDCVLKRNQILLLSVKRMWTSSAKKQRKVSTETIWSFHRDGLLKIEKHDALNAHKRTGHIYTTG